MQRSFARMGGFWLSAIALSLVAELGQGAVRRAPQAQQAQWSFPAAFARAMRKAGSTSTSTKASGRLGVRAHAFLQPAAKKQTSQLQRGSRMSVGPSDQLMARLTEQVKLGAQHLDELSSSCEAFRLAQQEKIDRVRGEVTNINGNMASNQAEENEASNTLSNAKSDALKLYDSVDAGRAYCKFRAQKNLKETRDLYDEIVLAQDLLKTDCEGIKAAKGMGFFLQGNLSGGPRPGKVPSSCKIVCKMPVGEIECDQLYAHIRGAIAQLRTHYSVATANARAEEERCRTEEGHRVEEMTLSRRATAQATADVASAMSALADLKAARDGKMGEQAKLEKELEEKNRECQMDSATLEAEIADAVRARKANYIREGGDPQDLIIDCRVSDWVFGECSQQCAKTPGSYGWMIGTREVTSEQENGGASCPSLKTQQKCGTDLCPVDCIVTEWTAWTKCNKACGGGTQTRSRAVRSASAHGGVVCPATSERQSCNIESCDQDCQLSDWTAWSTCSRVCRVSEKSPAGVSHRKRAVLAAASGEGSCPAGDADERLHQRDCNTGLCPANFTCSPDNQDIIVMIDGSWTGNFSVGVTVARELVKRASNTTRYGLTVYGNKAHAISPLTKDKTALLAALDKAVVDGPPKGETDVAGGLALVKTMLVAECSQCPRNRRETVLLLTDARPPAYEPAQTMVQRLQGNGVRVMVGFADYGGKTEDREQACGLATAPCSENVEVFDTWPAMGAEPERLVSAVCHGLESPEEQTIAIG